jgi:hypothetical protein
VLSIKRFARATIKIKAAEKRTGADHRCCAGELFIPRERTVAN